MTAISPADFSSGAGPAQAGAARRRGVSVKTLKKLLKKNGLKTTGKKAALSRRVKKAHLKMGGAEETPEQKKAAADAAKAAADAEKAAAKATDAAGEAGEAAMEAMGGRRRSRKNGLVKGVYRGVTGVAKGTLRSVGRVGRTVFGRSR